MLELFGLDNRAEAIYSATLARPDASVAELADELGLSQDEVTSVLDELAERCLLRSSWADPRSLRPVRPDIALEALVAREQADLARRRKQLEEGRAAIAAIVAEYAGHQKVTVGGEWGERLEAADAIRERIEQLTWAARVELLSVMGERAEPPPGMEVGRELAGPLLDRGVDVRSLMLESVRDDRGTAEDARWLTDLGGQVRTREKLPPRMLIFDRTHVLLPSSADDTQPGAVLVTARGMVAVLSAFFDQLWQSARPFGPPKLAGPSDLSAQQRQLLRLLYQGNTDDAAARKLGVSVRTVRKVTAGLMRETGARTRFQLGSRAFERGWLRFGE